MTLPTFDSARDEIQNLFFTYWMANTPAVNGGVAPTIQWQGVPGSPEPSDKAFARVTIRHNTSRQATFGAVGNRRFNRPGLVTIQIFAPDTQGQGLTLAQNLAIIARNAYEGRGTASGLWFRNTRIQEIGSDKLWFQINVVAEFEYDEQR